jgi:hypothetical protein
MENMFELGLDRVEANYTPLTPITFIQRTALAHPSEQPLSMAIFAGRGQKPISAV